jgi:sulfotransferase family protein
MEELERPAAPTRNPNRFSPVFVLTTARSYSSVVATMIGQHPELAGLPELKLFCYPTIGELEASLPRFWLDRGIAHRSPGLVRAVAQLEFGNQKPASLEWARTWLGDRSHWSGADVLDVLMERLSPREVVEKSPEDVESDAALRRLASAYPRARYLHLTRHPVTTQRSVKEHLNRTVPGYSMPGEPMSGVAIWVETHCRILRFAARLPKHRYMRVRAEDVLNDTRSQLWSIAAWLGVQTGERAIEAMTHPEASPFASVGPEGSGILGGNDPNFLRDPIPRSVEIISSLHQPPGWEGNSFLWQMTVDIANRLGYP